MPRRHDDQAFGSDSFLDVVANVVGILIILLVVVGVRVSRAPVTLPSEIQPSPSLTEVEPELPPAPPPVVRIPVPVPPVVELEPTFPLRRRRSPSGLSSRSRCRRCLPPRRRANWSTAVRNSSRLWQP